MIYQMKNANDLKKQWFMSFVWCKMFHFLVYVFLLKYGASIFGEVFVNVLLKKIINSTIFLVTIYQFGLMLSSSSRFSKDPLIPTPTFIYLFKKM